jgi:hypothetical protein
MKKTYTGGNGFNVTMTFGGSVEAGLLVRPRSKNIHLKVIQGEGQAVDKPPPKLRLIQGGC